MNNDKVIHLKYKSPADLAPRMDAALADTGDGVMLEYAVFDFAVGSLDVVEMLNQKAAEGWRLVTATRSEKRVLLFMERALDALAAPARETGE